MLTAKSSFMRHCGEFEVTKKMVLLAYPGKLLAIFVSITIWTSCKGWKREFKLHFYQGTGKPDTKFQLAYTCTIYNGFTRLRKFVSNGAKHIFVIFIWITELTCTSLSNLKCVWFSDTALFLAFFWIIVIFTSHEHYIIDKRVIDFRNSEPYNECFALLLH